MANYVWHRVICSKDTLDRYFLDPKPFGDQRTVDPPYISFNRLFGVSSLGEYDEKYGIHIYYGFDFSWHERPDARVEIKFTTRWEYPIRAILKALELAQDTVWYAVEENHTHVSKFIWEAGVQEYVAGLGDDYLELEDRLAENLQDLDDSAWYYLDAAEPEWKHWPSSDGFKRYLDVAAYEVVWPDAKEEDIS